MVPRGVFDHLAVHLFELWEGVDFEMSTSSSLSPDGFQFRVAVNSHFDCAKLFNTGFIVLYCLQGFVI